jgi:hypothetical protein
VTGVALHLAHEWGISEAGYLADLPVIREQARSHKAWLGSYNCGSFMASAQALASS